MLSARCVSINRTLFLPEFLRGKDKGKICNFNRLKNIVFESSRKSFEFEKDNYRFAELSTETVT